MSTLRSRLLLALASVMVILLSLELYARLGLGVRPQLERFKLDPELGWVWTPGYEADEVFYGVRYRMAISEQGLRNGPVTIPKPADTFRIVALGDSVTEGPGAELEQTFVKQVEKALVEAEPGLRVETVNAATGDYGTMQESLWLDSRGLAYEPDLVLVNVYLNDSRIHNNPPAIIAALDSFLGRTSAFYYYYRSVARDRMADAEIDEPDFRFRFAEAWESGSWKDNSDELTRLIQEAGGDWGLAWRDSELETIQEGLRAIVQTGERHGFSVLVVLFPVNVQVHATTTTELGLEKPQQNLQDFAVEAGIPVVDLLPILRHHRDSNLYYDQAHFTPAGHQIVADAVAQAIVEGRLLVED